MIETVYEWLQVQIASNEIFSGIIGGSLFASVLYSCKSFPEKIKDWFLFQFTTFLTVYNEDIAYDYIDEWLASHEYAQTTRRLRLTTRWVDKERRKKFILSPGPGWHLMFHGCRPMILVRSVDSEVQGTGYSGERRETITLRVLGRTQKPIRDIIQRAFDYRYSSDNVDVYFFKSNWNRVSKKHPRSIESVVLADNMAYKILDDAKKFFESEKWYADRSVPYRRGYLFEGPPGTGKTSFAVVLASEFNKPLYILNIGSMFGDGGLIEALSGVPDDAILLIEDIDSSNATESRITIPSKNNELIKQNPKTDKTEIVPISMSALLNSLDGIMSTDGRLLIMTTNYPDKLDSALVRPGRVDVRWKFDLFGETEVNKMFKRFFPESEIELKDVHGLSAAEVQGICMKHSDNSHAARIELLKMMDKKA